ncbi:MAG: nucleotidyl transferase AbiEii/AbiGii toxin family protein [Chitinispirillaceae bacterium]|nr:nucleotidyl transferase AbiEii/AbiGii toxin family protein [Chitinispirillaceae bacterium]
MHEGLRSMLAGYACRSSVDYQNALREIVQEIALLGLWRSKFFEHAAFYGGSALRILYELDRFSEDLDFSLLRPDTAFSLDKYLAAVQLELRAFGFTMTVEPRHKAVPTPIQSAFIKANTRANLLVIEAPSGMVASLNREQQLKVKIEIDIDPPGGFYTEARLRMLPISFSVVSYRLPDLFAGKMSAILCRQWKEHVKGRDWYDLVWFIARAIPLRLEHLAARLVQNGVWPKSEPLTGPALQKLLSERIEKTDFASARADVHPFVRDTASIELWSPGFFHETAKRLTFV